MKIIVTGTSGFIGKQVAQKFHANGHEVIGIDRNRMSLPFQTMAVDLMNTELTDILHEIDPDVIVHCAGMANVTYSMEHENEDFEANTMVVHRILFAMKRCGMEKCRFVMLSSAAVYGQPEQLPIEENANLKPMSPYALHKKMAEDICFYFINNYVFDIKILRIFSAYGPGLKKQIFWDMFQKINSNGKLDLFGNGNESRDYIYIDDLVDAIYLVTQNAKKNEVIFNVANGEEITIKTLAEMFAECIGMDKDIVQFNGNLREGDPVSWCANISRLKKIGYKKNIDIKEGMKRYIYWVKDEGEHNNVEKDFVYR